jgi:chromosome segregation ATPase
MSVSIDAHQLARLLQRVDDDTRRMASLETRMAAMERTESIVRAASRRAVSPPTHDQHRDHALPSAASVDAPQQATLRSAYNYPDPASYRPTTLQPLRTNSHVTPTHYNYRDPAAPFGFDASASPLAHPPAFIESYSRRSSAPLDVTAATPLSSRVDLRSRRDAHAQADDDRDEVISLLRAELQGTVQELQDVRDQAAATAAARETALVVYKRQVEALQEAVDATIAAHGGDDGTHSPARLFRRELAEKNAVIETLEAEVNSLRVHNVENRRAEEAEAKADADALKQRYEAKLSAQRVEMDQLEEHVALKQAQVASLEQRLRSTEAAAERNARSHEDANVALTRATEQLERSRREAVAASEELQLLRDEKEALRRRTEGLKDELVANAKREANETAAIKQLRSDLESATTRAERLEGTITELKRACDTEHRVVNSLRRDLQETETRLKAEAANSRRLDVDLQTAASAKEDLAKDLTRAKKDLSDAYSAVEEMRRDKAEAVKRAEEAALSQARTPGSASAAESAAMVERLSSLQFSRDMLQREVATLRKQLEAVTKDLEAAQLDSSALRRTATETSAFKVLKDENTSLRQEVSRLSVEWDRARDEVLRLQQRLRSRSIPLQ